MRDRLRAAYVTDSMIDVRSVAGIAARCELTVVAPAATGGAVTTWPLPPPAPALELLAGGRITFVPRLAGWLVSHRRRLDVVFVNDDLLAALAANVARRLGGPAVVLAIGRLTEEYVACQAPCMPWWRHRPKLWFATALSRANQRLADAAGVTGTRDAAVVARRNRRAQAIPAYGVDTEVFRATASRRDAKLRLGLPPDRPVVLYRSRVAPEKDPETFLAAIERMRAAGRDVHAVYQGGEHAAFAEIATRLGVEVELAPACPPAELAWWYTAADVVVQTSHAEALGISILEAQACGTPVVGSDIGGIPEAVGPGGIVVPARDPAATAAAIADLLDDPRCAARLADAGRAHVLADYRADDAFASWMRLACDAAGGRR